MKTRNWCCRSVLLSAVVGALVVSPGRRPTSAPRIRLHAALNCNLTQYKASTGLTTALEGDVLTVSWNGQGTSQLRARFAIDGGTPTIRDLSVRRGGGEWAMLGQNLTPEYQVTTGIRRMSNDQANAFCQSRHRRHAGGDRQAYRWYAFWDAPLSIPGYNPAPAGGGGRGGGGGAGSSGARRRRWDRAAPSPSRSQPSSRDRAAGRATTRIPNPPGLHRRPRHSVCRGRRKKSAAACPRSRLRRARSRATAAASR